jgi:cobalt-zinc-cadmium resistance protein CzcA
MKKWILFVSSHSLLFLLLFCSLILLALFVVKDLNVEGFPDPSPPLVELVTIYEGKSAEEVERQVTLPIEVALSGMEGLEKINSISLFGLSDIKCKFAYGTEYKSAKQEVLNRLAGAELPTGIQPSIIPAMTGEIMRYTLKGPADLMQLRTLQDWTVSRYLKTASGVEDVGSWGGYQKAYQVFVNPESLVKYGISLSQVAEALTKSNINVSGRPLRVGEQYYMVRGLGLIKTPEDIERVCVAVKSGKPVLIKNIAEVSIGNIPRNGIVGQNKEDDVVMGIVLLRRNAKSIPSIQAVHSKVTELNERILPKGIKVVPFYEKWNLIVTVIKKVVETASLGIILVAIVLFLFLGNWRAALLNALIIPISLLVTLALMAVRGESASFLSIGAIDFGIIADIPLIFTEVYFRLTRVHGPGLRSSVLAAEEIGRPMMFSVLIILLAFIPIFMMKGAEGQIFSPMAHTYLYAILITLVLTFTYLVAAKSVLLKGIEDREFGFLKTTGTYYLKLVAVFLKYRRLVLATTCLIVLGGLLIGSRIISTEFLPKMDEGNIYLRLVFPHSISLSRNHENGRRLRQFLVQLPEIKGVEYQVGRPEDGTDPSGPFSIECFVDLRSYDEWKSGMTKEKLEDQIREKLKVLFPNADINVSQYQQDQLEEVMSGVKGENSVKIFGDDLNQLDGLAQQVAEGLRKTNGIEDVGIFTELGQPNLIIEADRDNIAALGLTVQDVLDTVSAALGGKEVGRIVEGEKMFSLQLNFPKEFRREPERVKGLPVVLPGGGMVPLSRVANIHFDTGASFIYREEFRRFIPIKFSVPSNDLGGTVKRAQEEVAKIKLPSGYFMVWSGMFNEMQASFRRFMVSIPISLFLILTVLFLLYHSVRNVLITMAAPVFAGFAGFMSLLVTNQALSVSSLVGFISLVGVAVLNNSILVSYYIQRVKEGSEKTQAIIETVEARYRPVLMGGFVASLGLLPAALSQGIGSQVQKPVAIVLVGGMLVGMVIDLLITPLLLRYVEVRDE